MPSTEMIIWSAISGLIVLMLGIIGYLVKNGFESIKDQLAKIWEKLENNFTEMSDLRAEVEKVKARCEERGNNCPGGHHHNRVTDTRA